MYFAQVRARALPAIRVIGLDAGLRRAIARSLTVEGYEVHEALGAQPDAAEAPRDGEVVVVCPGATDADGMLALAALRRNERTARNAAYVFVLAGDPAPLARAVKGLSAFPYVAIIVARSSLMEALERQIALASRWLEPDPAPMMAPLVELGHVASA
jgi:hypothetical protein